MVHRGRALRCRFHGGNGSILRLQWREARRSLSRCRDRFIILTKCGPANRLGGRRPISTEAARQPVRRRRRGAASDRVHAGESHVPICRGEAEWQSYSTHLIVGRGPAKHFGSNSEGNVPPVADCLGRGTVRLPEGNRTAFRPVFLLTMASPSGVSQKAWCISLGCRCPGSGRSR